MTSVSAGRAPSHHARSRARRLAVQALYQWQISKQDARDIEAQFAGDNDMERVDVGYFQELLQGVTGDAAALEAGMGPLLDRPVREVDPVERAVLLIGAYELYHRRDIPYRVVINEAVRLAKTFGAHDGYKYVNGILDKLAHRVRLAEIPAELD